MPTKKKATATSKPTAKKAARTKADTPPKKMSALDAAVQVLSESGGSMTTKEMIEAMAAKKLWESPNGKTPAATLYAAILRELTTKGAVSRFQKTEPGKFAATGVTGTAESALPRTAKPKATKSTKANPAKKTPKAVPVEATSVIPDGTPGPESVSELFRI